VSTGYFDDIVQVVAGGRSSTTALGESTELEKFY
jgi:isocitrate lyase